MIFSSWLKGTPNDRYRRTIGKKNILQPKQMESGDFPEKMDENSPGDLYSMYAVLRGIGSLSCIRVYIIYVIPIGE